MVRDGDETIGVRGPAPRIGVFVALFVVLLAALYPLSRANYLLFHSSIELFTSIVLASIFVVAWNTRRFAKSTFLLALGMSSLFVSLAIAAHLLAYKGMGVFPAKGANLATQLWIVSRVFLASGLLASGIGLRHRINFRVMGGVFTIAALAATVSIFVWPVFPVMFVEGSGLTAMKIALEYIVIAVMVVALWMLWRDRGQFSPHLFSLLLAAVVLLIAAELAFTLYTDVYGVMSFLGHSFAAVALLLLYFAMVEWSLRSPYESLFLELKREQQRQRASAEHLEFLASHDGLTGLLNRRAFDQEAARALSYVARGAVCTMLYADVDGFKRCNDLLGHDAGDAVLRAIAAALRNELREVDVLARIGGDEFGIILWDRDVSDVEGVQRRLDRAVAEAGKRAGCEVGLSSGAVAITPDRVIKDLITMADRRMYEDKGSKSR